MHFAIEGTGGIRPLCGDWAGAPSWTKLVAAVSCPKCRALMARIARTRAAVPAM